MPIFAAMLVIFAAVTIFLGYYGYRNTKDNSEFLLGRNKTNPIIIGLSYGATFLSASAVIGFGGQAATHGLTLMWLCFLNLFVGLFVAFLVFGPKTRRVGKRLGASTFADLLGKMYESKGIRAFTAILIIVMMLFVLICTLPFINVIAMSMSSKSAILRGAVSFWPVEFNVDAYKLIVSDNSMWHSLLYTIELTVIYTVLAMVMTILVAFPLSMRRLKGQRVIMFFIVFTMYFSGGTIPIYLNVKEFHMLDSMWSLIIPGLISTFNVIILKNFFSSLPYELVEAASIDGATDFQVLTRIFLPLSFSSLATLSLFYAVGKWNSFNDALYYITSRELQPLQLKLYNLIKGSQSVEVAVAEGSSNDLSTNVSESIQSATIIFATLPILIVYPFVQRYFVAGVTMGAVKG